MQVARRCLQRDAAAGPWGRLVGWTGAGWLLLASACGGAGTGGQPSSAHLHRPGPPPQPTTAGGLPVQPPGGPSKNPCSFVTKSMADQIAGVTFTTEMAPRNVCLFTLGGDDPTSFAFTYDYDQQHVQADRSVFSRGRPVAGLGDEAYRLSAGNGLFVRKGSHAISLRCTTSSRTPDQVFASERTLVQSILPQL